jgi:hypothetical protein
MTACCVALGSECVEILLAPAAATDFAALAERASEWLGIDAPAVAEVMGKIVAEIPEIERLFDTKLLRPDAASVILDQARALLILRNLPAVDFSILCPILHQLMSNPPCALRFTSILASIHRSPRYEAGQFA